MYMLPVCRRSLSELKINVRTMLKDAATLSCPGRALLNRFCHAGTVVGWLMLMVQSPVQAKAGAERRYRLLSCPRAAAERGSPLSTLALSPSLTLLVSEKPLSLPPPSSSPSSGAGADAAEGSRLEHRIRVTHALSKEARQQASAGARGEATSASAVAEEARLARAGGAAVGERSGPGRGSISFTSSSSSRWPPRGSGGGRRGGVDAGSW